MNVAGRAKPAAIFFKIFLFLFCFPDFSCQICLKRLQLASDIFLSPLPLPLFLLALALKFCSEKTECSICRLFETKHLLLIQSTVVLFFSNPCLGYNSI